MTKTQKNYWESNKMAKRRNYAHPVIQTYVKLKIDLIKKFVPISDQTKVLEVGAGNGFFSYYLDKICDLTATDYSQKMIELNPAKNKQVVDVLNLKFPDDSFDIVFEANLLHHVDDIGRALDEITRVAREYIILIEPNRNNPLMFLFGLFKKVERQSLKFSLKFLRQELLKRGMEIIYASSWGFILPNKTPVFLLPICEKMEENISLAGFYNIFICRPQK